MMEQTMNYVKPELIVVAVVLYFIGMGLKQSQTVKDKYIPLILGGIGIVLCAVWVIASCPIIAISRSVPDRRLQWRYLQQSYRGF